MPRIAWLRFQSASVVSSIGGAGGDAGVRDDDVDAAVALHRRAERAGDVGLARDVALDGEAGGAEIGDRGLGALAVEVEGDHGCAERRERVDDGPADPTRGSRDERDLALQLARRRRQRELVELERPVLDREALGGRQRDEADEAWAPAMTSMARW